jgi:hypothetical protein
MVTGSEPKIIVVIQDSIDETNYHLTNSGYRELQKEEMREYMKRILDELKGAFKDPETPPWRTSTGYLNHLGIKKGTAMYITSEVLKRMMDVISSHFPQVSFNDLSKCKFTMHDLVSPSDTNTIIVSFN